MLCRTCQVTAHWVLYVIFEGYLWSLGYWGHLCLGMREHLGSSWKNYNISSHMGQQTGSKLGKEHVKAVSCHPAYFNFYAEYIMRNAGPDKAQAGIKIAGRNISNLRYADDTTLMEESEEELKSLLMKVKAS